MKKTFLSLASSLCAALLMTMLGSGAASAQAQVQNSIKSVLPSNCVS